MILANLSPLANHLWQSTICAAIAWLLTLALRKNRAAVRYWLWLASSVKFLIPFSFLVSTGSQLGWRATPAISPNRFSLLMDDISRPLALSAPVPRLFDAPAATDEFSAILFGLWFCGFTILFIAWFRSWRHIRAVQRAAIPLHLNLPIQVMSSPARLEPGVFGIRKPVLLLPEGITDRLTPLQLEAVLAHELCHVRRHDNLTAVVHMVVEAIFWFHPLVWWIRVRLMEERERACDEEVLRLADPEDYATGILNVCKHYLESPLVCASGVTGSDLKKRIETIMAHRAVYPLTAVRKILLALAGATAVAAPILIGIVRTPAARAQSDAQPRLEFDVGSVKANHSGRTGYDGFQISHGSLTVKNVSLKVLVEAAYGVQSSRVVGGPGWVGSDRYDIAAKGAVGAGKPQVWLMLRSLLADRFKVSLRNEVKELPIYSLELGRSGPKLSKQADADCQDVAAAAPAGGAVTLPCGTVFRVGGPQGGILGGQKVSISGIVDGLSEALERPVVDKTGLTGTYNFDLQWTSEGYQPGPAGEGEGRRQAEPAEPGPSILTAVREQLGLKLVAGKGPVQILVIDHAERPSGN